MKVYADLDVPYWEIDTYTEMIKRIAATVAAEVALNLKNATMQSNEKEIYSPLYDELVPPVLSPEKYFTF